MSYAPVDENGTQLYFTDSGPPKGVESYPTLVMAHGFSMNGHTFIKAQALASEHKFRLVALNRRSYRFSTPYSDAELERVNSKDVNIDDMTSFMRLRAVELAKFLVWYIKNNNIQGDIVLSGHSLGNQITGSFLAFADDISEEDYAVLQKHLKMLILYDPPHHIFSSRNPTNSWNPLSDESIPPNERLAAFGAWAGSHFDQDLVSRDPEKLNFRNPKTDRPPVGATMSAEDRAAAFDIQAVREQPLTDHSVSTGFCDLLTKKAFIEPSKRFPDLKIKHLYCTESTWNCVVTPWYIEDALTEATKSGAPCRELEFIGIEGGCHSVQWDEPENFAKAFALAMAS